MKSEWGIEFWKGVWNKPPFPVKNLPYLMGGILFGWYVLYPFVERIF